MRLWLMLLLTTSVRAGDKLTKSVRAGDELTKSVRAGDKLTTGVRAGDELTKSVRAGDELTHCKKLEKAFDFNIAERSIFIQGRAVPLFVLWDGHAPARAAAGLLLVLVTRGLRYRDVHLNQTEEYPLAEAVYSNNTIYDAYTDLLVWPAAAQRRGAGAGGAACGADRLCALRLAALGPGAAPAAVSLLVHLAEDVAELPECKKSNSWVFFREEEALRRCGFLRSSEVATVYYLSEYESLAKTVLQRASASDLRWRLVVLGEDAASRGALLQLLRAGNDSFLFIDHEVWSTSPRVAVSQPPPCINATCSTCLDPVYTVRLATAVGLDQFLPNVLNVIRKFSPTQEEIRQILELETELEVEEAACAWSLKNIPRVKSWFETEIKPKYRIVVFLCSSDPDYKEYEHVIRTIKATTSGSKFTFEFEFYSLNCSNDFDMTSIVSDLQKYRRQNVLLGVVGAGRGAKTAAEHADQTETALVLYDSVADEKSMGGATRVMGGPVSQLASAIAWFLESCEWARLAVVSERSSLATGIYEELKKTNLVLRNEELLSYTEAEFELYLKSFREANAKIFYLNTDANTASRVLCAAMDLNMTFDEGYVWVVREWHARTHSCGSAGTRAAMRHYSVSFWWRGQETGHQVPPAGVNLDLTHKLQKLWPNATWPMLAAPLADALLLLLHAAESFLTQHPDRASDMHGSGTARVFWASMNDTVPGVTRGLSADPAVPPAPLVYIDEWRGGVRPRSLAVWPATGRDRVTGGCGERTDGGKRCVTSRWYQPGDTFVWRCHDWAFLLTALALALAIPALFAARRVRLSRLRRRERMLKAREAAWSRRAAAALSAHLVARAAVDLRHELGAGRFGRVRLAVLRPPGGAATLVAAKALPEDATAADEDDFLQEAVALAPLEHEHIVRLVGVCGGDGPPLVLMEYAFFGDLAAYLRARRHLVERLHEPDDEAEHVSAVNLTRLASEAASALAYLATKRLVHRDVRAANCLVDARRALKLADFGLARVTAGAEYACARRGLFPVLWMAPESLDRGVFSAASDVWALGVLMFELVTLGERPYGDWPPLHVFRYVVGGGRPPLPPDASISTIGVLARCWQRAAERRPSAAALCAHLRTRPGALQPALRPALPATAPHTPSPLSLFTFMQ